jgi:hypothetical protein
MTSISESTSFRQFVASLRRFFSDFASFAGGQELLTWFPPWLKIRHIPRLNGLRIGTRRRRLPR